MVIMKYQEPALKIKTKKKNTSKNILKDIVFLIQYQRYLCNGKKSSTST